MERERSVDRVTALKFRRGVAFQAVCILPLNHTDNNHQWAHDQEDTTLEFNE